MELFNMKLSRKLATAVLVALSAVVNATAALVTVDSGGRRTTSTNYTMDVSLGGIGGVSTAIAPVTVAKQGYIGQLYEVTGLTVVAAPSSVSESSNSQLSATATLDDATLLVLSGSNVNWNTPTFPIASINAFGLLTPAAVYTDTTGTVSGYYLGASNSTTLLVLDTDPDNFGIYTNDGIPDAWQVQYFGPNNPEGLAGADADGTGQNNLFKYLAGLNPTNPASILQITSVVKNGHNIDVVWTCVGGHSYVLQSTRIAAINGFTTNFADASPVIAVPGTGESTTNFIDLGVLTVPILTPPTLQNTATGMPSTVAISASGTRGLADSLGQAIPDGSLLMIGTFNIDEPTIRSNFQAGNLNAIMSAFTPYTNSFNVGDGTGLPASWDVSVSAPGLSGQKIYLLATDSPTLANATHLGIFSAPSWMFPTGGNEIAIDLEDVTEFVVGAQGGPLTIGVGLGPPYTFSDTARLSYLPGRNLFYRVRLVQ
jgi:hypothetical protein